MSGAERAAGAAGAGPSAPSRQHVLVTVTTVRAELRVNEEGAGVLQLHVVNTLQQQRATVKATAGKRPASRAASPQPTAKVQEVIDLTGQPGNKGKKPVASDKTVKEWLATDNRGAWCVLTGGTSEAGHRKFHCK